MKRLPPLAYGLFVLLLLIAMGLTLPRPIALERSVRIEAPAPRVRAVIEDLTTWSSWSPWKEVDPSLRFSPLPDRSDGRMRAAWLGRSAGAGELSLWREAGSGPLRVQFTQDGRTLAESSWEVQPDSRGHSRVVWRVRRHGFFAPLVRRLSRALAFEPDRLGHGLSLLKAEVETAPSRQQSYR